MRRIVYPAEALLLDDIGYYLPKVLGGLPTESSFYEDYPLTTEAWLYTVEDSDPHYKFEDPQTDFKRSLSSGEETKKQLDKKIKEELGQVKNRENPI